MNWVFRIFNVGHVRGGNFTGIHENGDGVVEDAHGGNSGENDGVHYSRRRHETEPPVDVNEDCGEVYVRDGQNDDGYGQREAEAPLHGALWNVAEVGERRS